MADDTIGDVWRPGSKSNNDDASVDAVDDQSPPEQFPATQPVTPADPSAEGAAAGSVDTADGAGDRAGEGMSTGGTEREESDGESEAPEFDGPADDEPDTVDQEDTGPVDVDSDSPPDESAPVDDEPRAAVGSTSSPGASFALGGLSLGLPAPGRLTGSRVRGIAASVGRLLVLSPASMRLPLWLAAIVAAAWAAAVGLVAASILTALSGVADPESSLRTTIWLVAHHAPLATDAGTVSLLPLGLLLVTVAPLRRAGRFIAAQCAPAARSAQRMGTVGAVAVASYAALAGVIAATGRDLPTVDIAAAVFWAALVATCAGAWGAVRQERGRLPRPPFAVAVAVTVAVPLGIGVALTLATVLLGFDDIRSAQDQLAQPGMEQVGITLLQLAYLPNLVIWAAAFVMGTGVSLGIERGLSPFSADDAVLPDLPILTAIPADAPNWTAILPITVALGGALGAVVFARLLPERRLRRRITRAIALAVASGAFWWILMTLAGGSLGDGRLEAVGPAPGSAFVAMLLTSAGTLLWALLPTLASDARPVAVDLRERVSTAATAAKDVTNSRLPSGKR